DVYTKTVLPINRSYSENYTINPAVSIQIDNIPDRNKPTTIPRNYTNKEIRIDIETGLIHSEREEICLDFPYPFSDLFIWAVLTKRQDMAICMWEHGEEALAKALVGMRLYKSLAEEAVDDYIENEICAELREYSEQFYTRSLELLDHCHKHDDDNTLQLLTYELSNWGYETCLSLAVISNNKEFLAHPCSQILLSDLWHGGLRIRRHTNIKVIVGLLFPPYIFYLDFKSKEELMLQPQTVSEHEHDMRDTSSSSDESTSGSSSDECDTSDGEHKQQRNRKISQASTDSDHSLYGTVKT
uniref:TRPM-like domain-containing protein n=1 Tax=Acrobeloides nanus TaxID=290746 RepID=A0A914CYL5_9BILA